MSSIQIIVGSMLGGSEYVAEAAADVLEDAGHEVTLHLKPNLNDIEAEGQIWLICTSTHGTGELPDSIKTFAQQLDETDKDLSSVKFAVIALGDSGYKDSFCQAGTIMEDLLKEKSCTPIVDKLQIDAKDTSADAEDKAEEWVNENIAAFA